VPRREIPTRARPNRYFSPQPAQQLDDETEAALGIYARGLEFGPQEPQEIDSPQLAPARHPFGTSSRPRKLLLGRAGSGSVRYLALSRANRPRFFLRSLSNKLRQSWGAKIAISALRVRHQVDRQAGASSRTEPYILMTTSSTEECDDETRGAPKLGAHPRDLFWASHARNARSQTGFLTGTARSSWTLGEATLE
jgi:hypothetical protein